MLVDEDQMSQKTQAHMSVAQTQSKDILDVVSSEHVGGVFNPHNQKKSIDSVLKRRMADDFKELTGTKPAAQQPMKTGLQQVNATAVVQDPDLAKKEKLLADLERKNDEDSRKGLTVQIDPMKNQTFLAMVKNITASQKVVERSKLPLVYQNDRLVVPMSTVQVSKQSQSKPQIPLRTQHANMLDLAAQSASLLGKATALEKHQPIVSDPAQRMRATVLSMQARDKRAQHSQDFGTALQAHAEGLLKAASLAEE